MTRQERLQRDHQLLRAKLANVTTALNFAPDAWALIREESFGLSRWLHFHHERELAVSRLVCHSPAAEPDSVVWFGHEAQLQMLRLIIRGFLLCEPDASYPSVCKALLAVAEGLRDECELQERHLFPMALQDDAQADSGDAVASAAASEDMTVNRVLELYPETAPLFNQYGLDMAMEGSSGLDLFAWQRGMTGAELCRQLNQVIVPTSSELHMPAEMMALAA